jgi:hypothetical protein
VSKLKTAHLEIDSLKKKAVEEIASKKIIKDKVSLIKKAHLEKIEELKNKAVEEMALKKILKETLSGRIHQPLLRVDS